MRMKNPFGRDAGDENGGNDAARSDDPLSPPDQEDQDSGSDETKMSEGPSDETKASEGPSDETKMSEQPADEAGTSGSSDDPEGQEIVAPSVGPNTVIEKEPPEERLDFDKISDEDAMGRDKRRTVVGGSYGPSRTRVFGTFAAFFAIVAAIAVGFYFLAKELDQPPAENPAKAPWAVEGPDGVPPEQKPPRPIQ